MLQYEKALNDADIALSMNPKWIKGLYRKGKALVGLKVLLLFRQGHPSFRVQANPQMPLCYFILTQSCCFPFCQRYYEARLTYNEVLKLDSTCKDAAEEMMRVQLMQLMVSGESS